MNMNNKIRHIRFFLLFIGLSISICCFAEQYQRVTIGDNNVITNSFNVTTIIRNEVVDTVAILNSARREIEPIRTALVVAERELQELHQQLEQKSTYMAQQEERTQAIEIEITNIRIAQMRVLERLQVVEFANYLLERREAEIQARKWTYLPFGIHQFCNNQTGAGILFATTQIGGLAWGFISLPNLEDAIYTRNHEPHQNDARRRELNRQVNRQRWNVIGGFGVAAASIGVNYWVNFRPTRNSNVTVAPAFTLNEKGNPQTAMTIQLQF